MVCFFCQGDFQKRENHLILFGHWLHATLEKKRRKEKKRRTRNEKTALVLSNNAIVLVNGFRLPSDNNMKEKHANKNNTGEENKERKQKQKKKKKEKNMAHGECRVPSSWPEHLLAVLGSVCTNSEGRPSRLSPATASSKGTTSLDRIRAMSPEVPGRVARLCWDLAPPFWCCVSFLSFFLVCVCVCVQKNNGETNRTTTKSFCMGPFLRVVPLFVPFCGYHFLVMNGDKWKPRGKNTNAGPPLQNKKQTPTEAQLPPFLLVVWRPCWTINSPSLFVAKV